MDDLQPRIQELHRRLMSGDDDAYLSSARLKVAAQDGDPFARRAWGILMAFHQGSQRSASSSQHVAPALLDMYERLASGDQTSWMQMQRLTNLARSGDRQSAQMVAALGDIHEQRRDRAYGAPTTSGYAMPNQHRAGISPPIVVGADPYSIPGIPGMTMPSFPASIPGIPYIPGLPPLPSSIPYIPGLPIPTQAPSFPGFPLPGLPSLPGAMSALSSLLPLTEQALDALLALIRAARVALPSTERSRYVPMPSDEPMLSAARPLTPTVQRALEMSREFLPLEQAVYAPATRIIQRLTMR